MLENKEQIKQILENDGVIAFVTDTVWGLGCLVNSEKAVKKIYDIKKREAQKPLILMSDEAFIFLICKANAEKSAYFDEKIFSGGFNTCA